MLQKALDLYRTGGEQALKDWYENLTLAQRAEFELDVKHFLENLSGSLGGMGQIIESMFSSLSILFDDLPGEHKPNADGPRPPGQPRLN
jgi:hypothetical protein